MRPARFEDMEGILNLWREMMAHHETGDGRIKLAPGAEAAYRAYAGYHLSNSDSLVLAATPAEQPQWVMGFALVAISRNLPMFVPSRYGYLSDLAVDTNWRRQGVGGALVERVAAWLREREITTIQLQYYDFNAAGEAFWEAMGFKPFYTRMWRAL